MGRPVQGRHLLYIGTLLSFFGYSNLLLVHLRLKHRENVFSVRIWRYIRLLSKGDFGITLR